MCETGRCLGYNHRFKRETKAAEVSGRKMDCKPSLVNWNSIFSDITLDRRPSRLLTSTISSTHIRHAWNMPFLRKRQHPNFLHETTIFCTSYLRGSFLLRALIRTLGMQTSHSLLPKGGRLTMVMWQLTETI